jgi:hypothetical protein
MGYDFDEEILTLFGGVGMQMQINTGNRLRSVA